MNIYRNQSSPFFYCTPLYSGTCAGCGAAPSSPSCPGEYPVPYSASQWLVEPSWYKSGDSLRWSYRGGEGVGISPDEATLALTPGRDYFVSYLIQGVLPPRASLEVLPYFGSEDPIPFSSSGHSGIQEERVGVSGGFLLPAANPMYLTLQLATNSPAPISVTGSLHLFPLPYGRPVENHPLISTPFPPGTQSCGGASTPSPS